MQGVFEFMEVYLIHDLESMRKIKSSDGYGKCGYQMTMTLCSACEVLGSIEKNKISTSGGEEKFKFFLKQHLPEYFTAWKILYRFVRHRVAHDFITPPGIAVRLENDRERHLGMLADYFVIDGYVFMDDFLKAYNNIKSKYSTDKGYKFLMDKGYQLLLGFLNNESEEINNIIQNRNFKQLPEPGEQEEVDGDIAVPSGSAFYFDYSNITRIPDDMLQEMNLSIASGASGTAIDITKIDNLTLKKVYEESEH